jgi:cytochrome oxidase Cu insertion factor (SCO1/SenC/PrrC family)
MPGMNSGLNPADPTLLGAFHAALLHQLGIILTISLLLVLGYGTIRGWWNGERRKRTPREYTEPVGRSVLRLGFGVLWLFDGLLQIQSGMPAALPSQVIAPTAAASPTWVQHLVNDGGTIWSYHPVQAASAAVWIQIGIGVWLLLAADGWWSRLGGLASVGWGLGVWVLGESFGGIFAPGLSWLTGAPGAVLIYVAAGALIALPARAWAGARLGRLLLAGIGLFWIGMAVLQAWPGRGYWNGHGGTLSSMVTTMSQTSQPRLLSELLSGFAGLNGFAVNLVVVTALALFGATYIYGNPRLLRIAVPAASVFCFADWVLVQDLGFLGGLGTDPNSMIPWALLMWGGYQALIHPASVPAPPRETLARVRAGSVAAVTALVIVMVGSVPLAAAASDRNADPIVAESITGTIPPLDLPAPNFQLTSQNGQPVSLASLRGKVVLLTFLDPVCTTDCPIIAQEMKAAGALLGSQASRVELVAIAANPTYNGQQFTRAFDRQEGLDSVRNWLYLTGPLAQLQHAWSHYGVEVVNAPAGQMSAHNDLAVVIDGTGHIREEIGADPGPGTQATRSSFAVLLSDAARQLLAGP